MDADAPSGHVDEHAIIVGAAGTFGSKVAQRLVERGLHVIGVGRNAEALDDLAARLGPNFQPVIADIGEDSATDIIASALTRPVAMVVHAPGLPVAGGIRTAGTALLVEACNIKVGGMVRLVRAVEPRLRRSSRLVAVGGHYGFEPTAYAATAGVANAAVANLIRQLSWAYGNMGVTAHLVAPGPADSDRLRNVAKGRAERSGRKIDDELAEMRAESAIGAFVTDDQVAWGIAMLLAPEADALAGSTLFLDAGRRRGIP